MTPLATMSVTTSVARWTNGVAYPENGVENCGLKNVDTAGPIMAADMITVPPKPTEFRRSPGTELFTTSDEVSVFDMSYAALLRVRPRWDRGIIRQTLYVYQWGRRSKPNYDRTSTAGWTPVPRSAVPAGNSRPSRKQQTQQVPARCPLPSDSRCDRQGLRWHAFHVRGKCSNPPDPP